jgi:hypothetical protein
MVHSDGVEGCDRDARLFTLAAVSGTWVPALPSPLGGALTSGSKRLAGFGAATRSVRPFIAQQEPSPSLAESLAVEVASEPHAVGQAG